jgi:hypothetical protein
MGKRDMSAVAWKQMIEAVPEAMKLDRKTCRDYVVRRFSVESMVDEYERAYQMVLSGRGQNEDV